MKLQPNPTHGRTATAAGRRRERGMATLLFIILLAIMMIFVMVEASSLIRLHREVKLLEQQQIKRLNHGPAGSGTNAVTNVTVPLP
jgi:hypothetical protein